MRWLILFCSVLCFFSCNISSKKNIPEVHTAMPKPWKLMHFEEEFLPYDGYGFDPVLITEEKDLVGLLKWKGVDTGFHEIFDLQNENVIATYRPENDGSKRYSLWLHKESNVIHIKQEDLAGFGYSGKHTPAYIYFYRIPKTEKKIELLQ